jgi:hypothetical protein
MDIVMPEIMYVVEVHGEDSLVMGAIAQTVVAVGVVTMGRSIQSVRLLMLSVHLAVLIWESLMLIIVGGMSRLIQLKIS